MPKKEEPSTAGFVLSLIGGLLILGFGVIFTFMFAPFGSFASLSFMGIWGIFSGIFVITGSILAYANQKLVGGVIVIVFSVLSLFGYGGLLIGMILGIIGGILILVKK